MEERAVVLIRYGYEEERIDCPRNSNGSGKTTFAKAFLKEKKGEYYFLNADEIAKTMEQDKTASGSVAAGKVYFDRLARIRDKAQSVIIESTLSGKFLQRWIRELDAREYEVVVMYVFLKFARTMYLSHS